MREDIVRSVQQIYDEIGVNFSRTRQKTYGNGKSSNWPVTDIYLKRLKSGEKVLDLGCGNGKLITGLPEGVGYVGTDFSTVLLGEARRLHPKYDFREGNIITPKHWQGLGMFQAIFAVAVLHHIPETKQQIWVLREAKKHLLPGGFLYLTMWNLWQAKFAQAHLDSLELKKTNKQWVEIPFQAKWKRFCVAFDVASLTEVVTQAGWKIEELFYADREGKRADVLTGENLVCVAK